MGGGDDSDESDDDEYDGVERTLLDYNKRTSGLFILFTEFSPRRFVRKLTDYLQ